MEEDRESAINRAIQVVLDTYKVNTEEGSKAAVAAALELLGGCLKDIARIADALEERL